MNVTVIRRAHLTLPRAAAFAVLAVTGSPALFSSHAMAAAKPDKVAQCAPCHGNDGISTAAGFPNLAGQKGLYLAQALKDFRVGKRNNEVMNLMAKTLSDDEIQALAEYYESLAAK